jgi:hypothetical protein
MRPALSIITPDHWTAPDPIRTIACCTSATTSPRLGVGVGVGVDVGVGVNVGVGLGVGDGVIVGVGLGVGVNVGVAVGVGVGVGTGVGDGVMVGVAVGVGVCVGVAVGTGGAGVDVGSADVQAATNTPTRLRRRGARMYQIRFFMRPQPVTRL